MAKVFSSKSSDKHFQNIDLLRIIAASAVVIFHTGAMLNSRGMDIKILEGLQSLLSSGVHLFFVISGFVISSSLFSKKIHSSSRFIKSRIRRIFPLYVLLTSLTFLVFNISHDYGISKIKFNWEELVTSLFLLSKIKGDSVPIIQQGWTLEYEMCFYLVIGVCLFLKKSGIAILVACAFLSLLSLVYSDTWFLLFVIGVLTSFFARKVSNCKSLFLYLAAIFFSIMSFLIICSRITLNSIGYGLFYALILFIAATSVQLSSTRLIILGQISYATYLVQGLVIGAAYQIVPTMNNFNLLYYILISTLILSTCLIIGYILNKYFDQKVSKKLRDHNW